MNIETLVHVEIEDRLTQLGNMDPASDEYKATAKAVLDFINSAMAMEGLNIQLKDQELREKQMKADQRNRAWEHGVKVLGIVLPPTVALIGGFAYSVLERTEIVTSTPAREFLKRALRLS